MSEQSTADKVLDVLRNRNLKLKDEGGGNWRCNSPFRQTANSHSFTLTIHDGEHGAWDDKAGDESGSLYDLAEKLGVALPERTEVASTKHAYNNIAEYARAHGVDADVFLKSGWSDREDHHGRPALKFKTATGPRWRYIDGGKPPYWHDKGYKSCWYGLQRAIQIGADMLGPLVLVNGEASVLVAQHFRIAAACVTGSGERAIPDALLDELLAAYPEGEILVALDCDAKGRKATATLLKQFAEKGRQNVRGIDLMLGDTGDIADFCMLHSDAATTRLWDMPDAPPPSTKNELDLAQVAKSIDGLTTAVRQDARLKKQSDVAQLAATARAQIELIEQEFAAPQVQSTDELYDEALLDWERVRLNPDPVQGLRCNIRSLDLMVGGFQPEIYVIYGATSMGKSWLIVSICRGLMEQGRGLIVPTESVPKRWFTRLSASVSTVGADRIETGQTSADEHRRAKEAATKIRDARLVWLKGGQPTVAQVRAATLDAVAKHDIKWVLVDSASKMTAPGTQGIYDRTVAVSDGLQNLMAEANIPIIVTSQIGRDVAGRSNKLPTLEDAYGGGAIEHNAGVVLGLYRHEYYVERGSEKENDDYPPGTALTIMLKNRWRGGGGGDGIHLAFRGACGFYELDREVQRETA